MRKPNEIPILELLPQRPPFVMVDRLNYCDENVAVSQLAVKPDNIFCDNGILSPAGLIENIAQTCAARIGYQTLEGGDTVKIGVIGAISNMDINATPAAGAMLNTRIEVEEEVFSLTLVKAEVFDGETLIADGHIKIALTDKEAQQ